MPQVEYKMMKVAELLAASAEYNPRSISTEARVGLSHSIDRFGLVQPPVLNLRTHRLVGGHRRVEKLHADHIEETMTACVDISESEEKALNLALNNPKIEGSFIPMQVDILLAELRECLPDVMDDLRLDALAMDLNLTIPDIPPPADVDFVPESGGGSDSDDVPPVSRMGDIFQLGPHRVMCADCTQRVNIAALCNGKQPRLVVTDPPYNVAYSENTPVRGKDRTIANDHMSPMDFHAMLTSLAEALYMVCEPGTPLYMFFAPRYWSEVDDSLKGAGFKWSKTIVWVKDAFVLAPPQADYHSQYEPIWFGWHGGAERLCRPPDRTQSDVWNHPRPGTNPLHPNQKPVDLLQKAVMNSSKEGDIVIDPFAGSGSTLVAAHNLGRIAYVMELEPRHVDTLIERWVMFTNEDAVRLEPDGTRLSWRELRLS